MLHIMRTIVYIRFKYGNKQGKRKKIKLEKHDSSTRSATSTLVEAYADDYIVSVSVENYTGDIYVQVYGAGGAAQTVFFVLQQQNGYARYIFASRRNLYCKHYA